MTATLVIALIAATGAVVTFALLSRKDRGAQLSATERAVQAESRASMVASELEAERAAHAVTHQQYAREKTLRAVAEAQRNEAMRRVRDYMSKSMTNEEIQDAVDQLFATPLAVAPRPDAGELRRETPRSEAPGTALVDPWTDV